MENLKQDSVLDRSKPYVPNLESSDQLEESQVEEGVQRVEIDATPLPVRKKYKRAAKTTKKQRDENKPPTVSAL